MDKDLVCYNIVRLFREDGYDDDQIAEILRDITEKLKEEKVNG